MRDALLLLVILGAVPFIVRHPFTGVLAWAWFTIMTPHQLAYGVFGVPLNMVIAAVTFSAYLVTGQFPKFRADATTVLAGLFAFWLVMSQIFSLAPENSQLYFDRFIKTMLFAIICMQMADTKLKVNALLWMLVGGMGFFALKGGLFTLLTFGQFRVHGLPQTVLEDNNHIGIAIATILPLILYVRETASEKFVRNGALVLFGLALVAIVGTHSRGAFIALVMFGVYLWFKSSRKIPIAIAAVVLAMPLLLFVPSKWTERMTTITEATQDKSFMARVDAWIINTKFAIQNPVTGAGLRNPYDRDLARLVDRERAEEARAGHSIYFEILGGTGFVGLAIYLSMLASGFLKAHSLSRERPGNTAPRWARRLAYHAQISLAVFAIGGASTSMEMWDGYLLVLALIAAVGNLTAAGPQTPRINNAFDDDRRARWRKIRERGDGAATPAGRLGRARVSP
ncbi:MAG: putative O-glycosylation ligase, exosortase A system-associated [Pseudomonadota bacterium]